MIEASWDVLWHQVRHFPQVYSNWWWNLVERNPGHVVVETSLILFVIYILVVKKTLNTEKPSHPTLSRKEVDELLEEWTPEPLVPALTTEQQAAVEATPVVERLEGGYLQLEGSDKRLLNLASFDFLGMGQRQEMKEAAEAALNKYGCGSCGPRGFYGTIDVHLKMEEAVARFMGVEEAILYSDSAATVSSTIPAFAKRGDLILADQGVHEPVQSGLELSRSTVRYFRHNDMQDLERLLKEEQAEDRRLKRDSSAQRRFIAVEGLYRNYGDVCPLKELVELKKRYGYRLILDEGLSFGVLGATGRGVTELLGVPVKEVEIIMLSMAHSLASIGGLTIGDREVVDHQRLSAGGYCFSASAPPFVSAAGLESLRMLQEQPELLEALQANVREMRGGLAAIPELQVLSWEQSPIIHVGLAAAAGGGAGDVEEQIAKLARIQQACHDLGYAVTCSKYLQREKFLPQPTLRLTVNARHTTLELADAVTALAKAARDCLT